MSFSIFSGSWHRAWQIVFERRQEKARGHCKDFGFSNGTLEAELQNSAQQPPLHGISGT